MPSESSATARQSDDVEISYILGDQIFDEWEWIGPLVGAALKRDRTMIREDVLTDVADKKAMVWVASVNGEVLSAAVTREVEYPSNLKALEVLTLGGELFWRWAPELQKALKEHMKHTGCSEMRALCRPGMGKYLRELGWKAQQEVMTYGR